MKTIPCNLTLTNSLKKQAHFEPVFFYATDIMDIIP